MAPLDIRTWHANIEQHASEGVNKILIGNKCDWDEKRAVTLEQGRQLADEFGLRFLETSAKDNEGVEEAFFTLARSVNADLFPSYALFANGCVILQGHQDPSHRQSTGCCCCRRVPGRRFGWERFRQRQCRTRSEPAEFGRLLLVDS